MSGKYHIIPKIDNYTRNEVIGFMRNRLLTNDNYVIKGLITLYNKQTDYEKRTYKSNTDNYLGFSKSDAPLLSNLYKAAIRDSLNNSQLRLLHKTMYKYAAQLCSLSDPEKLKKSVIRYYECSPE